MIRKACFFVFFTNCILSHIYTCIILEVQLTTHLISGEACLFVMFSPHELVFPPHHFPCWLKSEHRAAILALTGAAEPRGTQWLLSSQCRSCGAGSSYIWLLGLRWQPCYSGYWCFPCVVHTIPL